MIVGGKIEHQIYHYDCEIVTVAYEKNSDMHSSCIREVFENVEQLSGGNEKNKENLQVIKKCFAILKNKATDLNDLDEVYEKLVEWEG